MVRLLLSLAILLQSTGLAPRAEAETVRIAVAANFRAALVAMQPVFERESGDRLAISVGSTGVLTSQILLGAPFDVLLAADEAYPTRLVAEGAALDETRATYALGRLALVASNVVQEAGEARAELLAANRIAIANPKTAPYGAAALKVLEALAIRDQIAPKLVYSRNISGAFAAVHSGAAQAGIVALSALYRQQDPHWPIPPEMHEPLRQQAVMLKPGADNPGARRFLAFLVSPPARQIIAAHGYGLE